MTNLYSRITSLCILLTVLFVTKGHAQIYDGEIDTAEERIFYFGFDLGPKYDHYRINQVGGPAYSPSVEIVRDIGATAGITAGFFMDSKYLVSIGIYRNNYKAKLDFISPQGNNFFSNTIVNTFSSYAIPIRLGTRINSHSPRSLLFFQVGVTTLLNPQLDFEQTKFSYLEEKYEDGMVADYMRYEISDNVMDGKIMTLDAALTWNIAVKQNLFFTAALNARMGIGGENRFTTSHYTANEDNSQGLPRIVHEVSTNGTGFNLTVGFRYFMFEEDSKQVRF